MLSRITLMASAIAALVVSASAFMAQPGQAQTTAQAKEQAKENECLSRPQGVAPRGSHWFYRLDRANGGRRCWYLGPESQKARRAATERKAAAAPPPLLEDEAPPLPRARTERRSVATMDANAADTTPANNARTVNATANTSNAPASAVDTSSVTAARFSAAWPAAASNPAGPSDREGATAAARGDADEATTTAAQDAAPAVSPAPVSADAAAAGLPSEPAPGLGHLLLFFAATIAFIAIAVRALLKMLSPARPQVELRPAAKRSAPVIRQRAPERRAFDHITEPAMREDRALRPLDVASRWDSAARLPRTASVPLYDDMPGNRDAPFSADEGAALRRRRRVA